MRDTVSGRLNVLFVCALNQWRSPTAEHMYRSDPRLSVRSAGIRPGAKRRISESDLQWAHAVMVMEREQKRWIEEKYSSIDLPKIVDLDIPDSYQYMDPQLQDLLRASIDPELEVLLAPTDETA